MTVEDFLEKVGIRPLPDNPMLRIKIMARELAEGCMERIWEPTLDLDTNAYHFLVKFFLKERFPTFDERLDLQLLQGFGYLEVANNKKNAFGLTPKAFNLLEESETLCVFVCYAREESSVLALLVANTLQNHGITAFVDMQFYQGHFWRDEVKVNIENSDYVIALLGQQSLASDVVLKELNWAVQGDTPVIPVWHRGFNDQTQDWDKLPQAIKQVLREGHTIHVGDESPLAYTTALAELLNRFGIMP